MWHLDHSWGDLLESQYHGQRGAFSQASATGAVCADVVHGSINIALCSPLAPRSDQGRWLGAHHGGAGCENYIVMSESRRATLGGHGSAGHSGYLR
jgi:hypothetical protein